MANRASQREPDFRMSRDDYLAWAEQQPAGRFERIGGVVVAMAPERVGHNICKFAAHRALRDAVRQSGLPCQVLGDRVVVSVDDSDFEPDLVLHCAERLLHRRPAIGAPHDAAEPRFHVVRCRTGFFPEQGHPRTLPGRNAV